MSRFIHAFRIIAITLVLLASSQVHFAQQKPIEIDLEKADHGAVISPLLFGHNLEVTRRGFWGGISAQMVANRKFAAVQNGLPKQWEIIGGASVAHIDTGTYYAGRQSLRLTIPAKGLVVGIRQQQQILAVKKGDVYEFRIWIKTSSQRSISFRMVDSSGKKIYTKQFKVQPGEWELLTSEFKASVTSVNCKIEIITQDPGQFWIGAVSLMPFDNFHGMRKDVVELLKKLQPGCLRFPGGCYAEFYSWKDGLLPVDKRSPIYQTGLDFLLRDTDDTDNHEMGIDEFIALCKVVGAEPIITARVSENSPQDAADWVSYCNGDLSSPWGMVRIERGHQQPFNVRWWFVGNELYSFGRGLATGIKGASEQSILFSKAMKEVDSSINLVPSTQFGSGNISADWNSPLLNTAGNYTNAVTAHQYMLDTYPLNNKEDYSFLINSPELITLPMLRSVRNYIDKLQFIHDKKTGITFDEWNTRWGLKGSVPMGLYVARMLNLLCREGNALGLSMACYFMPVNEGAIKVSPLEADLDPAGQVFDIYKVHQRNILLQVQKHTSVDICASKATDGKTVCLTAVNDIQVEQQLQLDMKKYANKVSEIEIVRLTPRSLDINEVYFDRSEDKIIIGADGLFDLLMKPGEVVRLKFHIPLL